VVLSISSGYSPDYLLKEVATGRENYYTGAVAEGEPPGRWWGSGAELLGLRGLVDAQDMRAVYERFLDPREEGFTDPARWDEVYTLGHPGRRYLSEDELYAQALEREPDADAERKMELRVEAGKMARRNVAFFDLTFNVQKSVTLLHSAFEAQQVAAQHAGQDEIAAAWGQFRQAVEDAIWAGNNAMLAYLNANAGYSRIGHHGGAAGRWIDAPGWVVASFFQHDSREHDPHLHIHNAFLNRVLGDDGVWRTVDSRALFKLQRAAAAVGERTMEERLTHALGVLLATRPDGKAREVVGITQQGMDMISTRRRQVTAKARELVGAFEAKHGRSPNSLELDRLAQQATLLTRRAKSHTGETREQLLDRVDAKIRADLDGGLAEVAHTVLEARGSGPVAQEWSPQAVIELALEDVRARKSGWTRADLVAAVNAALPDYLGLPDGADVAELLDTLTDDALEYAVALDAPRPGDDLLPDELRLRNGRSVHEAPNARLYATPEQVRAERALVAATTAGGATALPDVAARRFLEQLRTSGIDLGADQAAAVRGILTSGQRIECLIGPAGTGKSFVIGALAHAWTNPRHATAGSPPTDPGDPAAPAGVGVPRRVFGLATSQIATDILAAEGLTARNVARWLATQQRLAAGPGSGSPRPVEGDEAWRLHAGDLVVVDESAMADTAALAAIYRHVEVAGAKLLLVGDHKQLAAVGAGGAMDLLARAGTRYELTEARRFTHAWEREASLRLRDGDESVLRTYHQHGRLLDAGTREQAEHSAGRAWLADTLAGRNSVLLVDDNAAAARLCGQLRAELVRLGRVAEHGVPLAQGSVAGVGDLVQARWNGWELAGVEGNRRGPINRETYEVLAVRDDGALEVRLTSDADTVRPDGEAVGQRLVLPASYVAGHLALAYASTVHAAQGRTTDTSHAVITSWTSPPALYVALSRGRDANTAHVATTSTIEDPAQGRLDQTLHRDPVALVAQILDQRDRTAALSTLAIAAASAEQTANVATPAELLADAAALAATERTTRWLDQLTDDGHLTAEQRAKLAAEDGAASLGRTLRRLELAGLDPHEVLRDAVADRPLTGATNATSVIVARVTDHHTRRFDPLGTTWADWVPRTDSPAWNTYLAALAQAADERTAQLGRDTAARPPAWALEALGPVPDVDDAARAGWEQRAGLVAAYRELRGHTDDTEALGRPPAPGRQAEAYAAYRAAWDALGRPRVEQAEHEMTNGAHRQRVRAWQREQAIAPRYVGNELAGTRQAATHHHQVATLRAAEADAAADPTEQARLRQEAADARALADTLDHQAAQLEELDRAYLRHRVHSAVTRVNGEASAQILADRHVDDEPEQHVTAEEWLAVHRAALVDDEMSRAITEDDIVDHVVSAVSESSVARTVEDVVEPDLREVAAVEPRQTREDETRVPDADEMLDSAERARRLIHEINAREAYDQWAQEDERAAELARWHADDQDGDQRDTVDGSQVDDVDALVDDHQSTP
jgi:conjugative relaxase-like TrwC/TraI family protein